MKQHDSIVPDLKSIIGADKLRKQLHISGINMLNECGIRFEFRYILGMKRKPNAFLHCGTGTDKAVSSDLTNKIDKGELLAEKDVQDIAASAVKKSVEENGLDLLDEDAEGKSKDDVVGETVDKAVRLVTAHHSKVAPSLRPKHISRRFSVTLDRFMRTRAKLYREDAEQMFNAGNKYAAKMLEGQATRMNSAAREGWDFAGEWDIIEQYLDGDLIENVPLEEKLVIRDTKTSKKTPSEDEADKSTQLSGYAVAATAIYGKTPDALALDFLVDLKRGTEYAPRFTTRTPDDDAVFFNRLANAVNTIKSGIFTPTKPDDWRCSKKWCGYFEVCPYAKRPKSVLVNINAAE
jgi:hypothetical protein